MTNYNKTNSFKYLSRTKAFEELHENVFEISFDQYIFTIGCIGYHVNQPDIELKQHSHSTFFECHYICRGTEICDIGNDTIKLTEGMCIIIPPGKNHKFLVSDPEFEYYSLGGSLRKNHAINNFHEDGQAIYNAFNSSSICICKNLYNVTSIFDAIYREMLFFNASSLFNIKLNITRILFETTTSINLEKSLTDSDYNAPSEEAFLIINYIHENINKNLAIENLADFFHRSSRQLMRIFKNATGESIGSYIKRVRMEYARDLLTKHDLTLKYIAGEVGFSSEYNFSLAFKKHHGISPSLYRKNISSKH